MISFSLTRKVFRFCLFHWQLRYGKPEITLLVYVLDLNSQFFAERVVKVWNSLPTTTNFATLPVFRQSIMCADFSAFLKVFLIFQFVSFVLLRHWYSSYHCFLEIVF